MTWAIGKHAVNGHMCWSAMDGPVTPSSALDVARMWHETVGPFGRRWPVLASQERRRRFEPTYMAGGFGDRIIGVGGYRSEPLPTAAQLRTRSLADKGTPLARRDQPTPKGSTSSRCPPLPGSGTAANETRRISRRSTRPDQGPAMSGSPRWSEPHSRGARLLDEEYERHRCTAWPGTTMSA